jgi:DNA-binding beta-propeller fold protein YncE
VDKEGRQYVCEFENSRIQIFDTNGQSLEIIGGPGYAPGQFSNPYAIALDSHGNLYVADSMNHRVQKFIRRKDVAAAQVRKQSAFATLSPIGGYAQIIHSSPKLRFAIVQFCSDCSPCWRQFPLSPRGRVGVRGKAMNFYPTQNNTISLSNCDLLCKAPIGGEGQGEEAACQAIDSLPLSSTGHVSLFPSIVNSPALPNFLPLPQGEGRGEGEQDQLHPGPPGDKPAVVVQRSAFSVESFRSSFSSLKTSSHFGGAFP